ncbi:MAG: hypothetical protein LCH85_10705 [Chloroflexi bacterium]|nr:hypothetical protein [Chloroflexota bacterium]
MKWQWLCRLGLLLSLGFFSNPVAASQSQSLSREIVSEQSIYKILLEGQWLVWQTQAYPTVEVFITNLVTNSVSKLAASDAGIYGLTISNGRVIWSDTQQLYSYDIHRATTKVQQFPDHFNPNWFVAHGDWLIWSNSEGTPPEHLTNTFWKWNINDNQVANLIGTEPATIYGIASLQTDGEMISWAYGVGPNRHSVCYELHYLPLDGSTSNPITLPEQPCSIFLGSYRLINKQFYYCQYKQLYVKNLDSTINHYLDDRCRLSSEFELAANRGMFFGGNYTADDYKIIDIVGYDLANQSLFTLDRFDATPYPRPTVAVNDRLVAWSDQRGAKPVIHVRPIAEVVPTAPRQADDPLLANRSYYPESQHSLGGLFEQYWQKNGGLAVFGYPQSEEFSQVNADTGKTYTVQLLERQRYEHHPELAGTAYEVSLGRLGAERLITLNRHWQNEGDTSAGAEQLPGQCQHFATTDRKVCGAFLSYWQSHGLDLGDAGISYAESLALFGLPLTAPHMETNPDGDWVLTQWFERARFEWHPANPAEFKVQLGRLAAEQIPSLGW